jgi:CcmD family protein
MDHFPYLFAAFSLVWIALFFYVVSIDRRSRRAEKELEDLQRLLDSRTPNP